MVDDTRLLLLGKLVLGLNKSFSKRSTGRDGRGEALALENAS